MRKLIFVVLVIALLIGFFGSAMAQESYTVGEQIYLPVHKTLPTLRFCTDYNRDNLCSFTEFLFPAKGAAVVISDGVYEIATIQTSGWVYHGMDCRLNPVGCSAQGVRMSGLRCWKSEPTAIDEKYIAIAMQEVDFDECYLETP